MKRKRNNILLLKILWVNLDNVTFCLSFLWHLVYLVSLRQADLYSVKVNEIYKFINGHILSILVIGNIEV